MSGSGSGDLRIRNMHWAEEELRIAREKSHKAQWDRAHALANQLIDKIGAEAFDALVDGVEHTPSEWISLFEQALAE